MPRRRKSEDETPPPHISFIGIVDFSQEARWLYMTGGVRQLLGYEPSELQGRPSIDLVHPDEAERVRMLHYDTIQLDKAACLVYLRMKHKDHQRGYVLCAVQRTIVHNAVVGSVSYATERKALRNNATAREVNLVSDNPENIELSFGKWGERSPMLSPQLSTTSLLSVASTPAPTSPSPSISTPSSPPVSTIGTPSEAGGGGASNEESTASFGKSASVPEQLPSISKNPNPYPDQRVSYDPLPAQSHRTAFILDRFTLNCRITYMTNDLLIPTTAAIGRPFFDFVSKRDEKRVRGFIETVKSWGVNENGAPSDGGFGYAKFMLCPGGRNSEEVPNVPDTHRPGASRSKKSKASSNTQYGRPSNATSSQVSSSGPAGSEAPATGVTERRSTIHSLIEPEPANFLVDAILSSHSDGLMVILRQEG